MYQEVQATIVLTYSADATLSRLELLDHVLVDACRLLDGDSDNGLELVHVKLERLREEAQIYSDVEVTP
jgi:hypothetical protein